MRLTEKIAVASVATILFKILIAGIVFKIGGYSLEFGTIDSMTVAALLTPTVASPHLETFVTNRKAVKKYDNKE